MIKFAPLAVCSALAACTPELGAPQSLVSTNRILAVKGEPAEAAPEDAVTFTALVASPEGTKSAQLVWGLCVAPKPLAENNVVSLECTRDMVTPLSMVGPTSSGRLPDTACSLFGPDTPPSLPGQPPLRARDPDVTGGYYQPVRATFIQGGSDDGDVVAFGLQRISCNLANAPVAVVGEFGKRYTVNHNPALESLSLTVAGGAAQPVPVDGQGAPPSVAAGASVTLRAAWKDGSAESYPVFDVARRALVDHREALRLSWYATGGAFEHDRTGRGEDETVSYTDNAWVAPDAAGPIHLWTVLRDSRGGVDFASFTITVTAP